MEQMLTIEPLPRSSMWRPHSRAYINAPVKSTEIMRLKVSDHRDQHGVDVYRPETHLRCFFRCMRKAPMAVDLAIGKKAKVVRYILGAARVEDVAVCFSHKSVFCQCSSVICCQSDAWSVFCSVSLFGRSIV